ncbi:hypothetical protein [Gorillibacterium timonense]|uniref:hypothetical protein n=1 Tax=Gorillibacterium timonense TaxID=1689269 RepID=UPI00071C1F27|nr:hypothetical protein [Gorillibacterium timonense]
MVVKRGLPEDMTVLLRQLVMNGHIRIAGTVLYVYFVRCWQLDEECAAYYMQRYFQKYYASQLQKHKQRSIKT